MEGVSGFRSDLYRNDKSVAQQWVDDIRVKTSSGSQLNLGWRTLFGDGSKFMDVLSTKAGVFEIRTRTKVNGRWQSVVLYEDVASRPVGYTGLEVSCNSCHNQAGTGGYAVGLVPGGDGVLSVPFTTQDARFPALER